MFIAGQLKACTQVLLIIVWVLPFGVELKASELRLDAKMILEERGFDTSFESLSSALLDVNTDLKTRQLSALALGQSKYPRALDVLSSALTDGDIEIRGAALRGMRDLSDPRAIPTLRSVLVGDDNPAIKQVAITALRDIDNDEAYNAIGSGLQLANQDETVRISIVETLRAKPSFDSKRVLNELLADGNSEIRARAAITLSERDQLSSDQILVDAATKYDIPHHVWVGVVSRLEKSNRTSFGGQGQSNYIRLNAENKQRVNARILGWWSDKNAQKK